MSVTRSVADGIATIGIDDGKVNAFDLELFEALTEAFDACAEDAAVVVAGRDGFFSGGLNTKKMAAGGDEYVADLLVAFGRVMHRIWLEPRPVVVAATGHAVAGGTILAMCADHAVAAAGDYRWGLIETTIGFAMPRWVIAIARGNVRADRLDDLMLPGAVVGPEEAVAVGYADVVADPAEVVARAHTRAAELAQLPRAAYAETKRRLREAASQAALATLEAERAALLGAG